ncbi:MAG TPA: MBOAT family O-acyltransferase [Desulfuromonadales bacterium]|nr:MBOAT family O-acyltransferase [Desulfuromonadales bacterium]
MLVLVAMTTYSFGIWLDQTGNPKIKRALLWGGIAINVLILVAMKYLPFLSENLQSLATFLSIDVQSQPVNVFVAIGVSYYVFQAISYLFDIYLELEKPERHFGYFALYLAFFPKLLQGPIERAGDLIPQLKIKYEFNYDNMRFGMLLFTWGLFKKVVIADRIGLYVDVVYNDVYSFTGLPLLLATYAYAFQIYMDFSGYTDMALGTALMFNINLTQNFNSPYLATSVADFWRRWHITFSRWILDYIFKPLQMQWRNWRNWGTASALVIAFLISGIWHGASWGFVIWGGLHGLYLACSVFYKPYQKKLHKFFGLEKTKSLKIWQIFVTFNLVSFSWVFFRANSLTDAMYILSNMINIFHEFKGIRLLLSSQGEFQLDVLIISILLFFAISTSLKIKNISSIFIKHSLVRWLCYYSLVIYLIFFRVVKQPQFLYFAF